MFEARLPVQVNATPALCEFIKHYFKDGPPECQIQDIEEYALSEGRGDLMGTLQMTRAEYGNLWLRREFWI